jgi:twinkle protein
MEERYNKMTSQTLEDILITDKEVEGYMDTRDSGEHLKIKRPSEYLNDVEKYFAEDLTGGLELPFKKTADDFKIRMGEISLVTGYSGHGKSAWLNQVMLHLMKHEKTMIASFEMLPKATLGRMCQQTGEEKPNYEYIKDFLNQLEHNLYLYDPEGETSSDKVLEVIYYCAEKLGVKLMVIDSLMKCGINEDDLNKQKAFANKLAVAARDLGIHIFIVAHSRKTADENANASKFDVAGSANLTNLVDNVISVHRNKGREIEAMNVMPDETIMNEWMASVWLLKQRHGKGIETKWGFSFEPQFFRYSEDKL